MKAIGISSGVKAEHRSKGKGSNLISLPHILLQRLVEQLKEKLFNNAFSYRNILLLCKLFSVSLPNSGFRFYRGPNL